MKGEFTLSMVLKASPQDIFEAWLSSQGHTAMTGSPAEVDGKVGGAFKAWDGYIWGETLELEPARRILQAWRTNEFPEGAPDSRLEVLLEEVATGTELTLVHTEIPEGQSESYKQGWLDFYFKPMQEYFK
jgi:activator of HSP90 ATPase